MQYLKQFFVILAVSFLGEACHALLPWPIPASIYGMGILFLALQLGVVKLEQVQDAASFLVSILPVLFVAPAVSLIDCWQEVAPAIFEITVIIVLGMVFTFFVGGKVTQWIMDRKKTEVKNG